MNVLFHQGALGDFVVLFPLLKALAPTPTVVVAADSKAQLAARLLPHVVAMSSEAQAFARLYVAGDAPAVPALQSAAAVFSFVSSGDDVWAGHAAVAFANAKRYFIQPRPPREWRAQVWQWHEHQLREQGWSPIAAPIHAHANRGRRASADIAQSGSARVALTPDAPIVVHPGSGGREKCWPAASFEVLMDRLRGAGRRVTPLLGEVELERWPPGLIDRWRRRYDARLVDSLDDLHRHLSAACLYIGNDAGPTHLAAWLGVTTLALFGPSDAVQWRPVGPDVKVIISESGAMADLTVQRVWEVVSASLPDSMNLSRHA